MKKEDIFTTLVRYHITYNLPNALEFFDGERICDSKGNPLVEGSDKDVPHDGFLLVADGDTLTNRLQKDNIVLDQTLEDCVKVDSEEGLMQFLYEHTNVDGAYVCNTSNDTVRRVREFNNNIKVNPKNKLPSNFYKSDGVSDEENMRLTGTKTSLAMKAPWDYTKSNYSYIERIRNYLFGKKVDKDVESFQIKRSAYGKLGMGKVTHFKHDGLHQEFFFRYDKNREAIMGVHKIYDRDNKGNLINIRESRGEVLSLNKTQENSEYVPISSPSSPYDSPFLNDDQKLCSLYVKEA